MRKERHHVVPISLYGADKPCNIKSIKYTEHRLVHQVLNIPMSKYSRLQRNFKMRINHKLVLSPSDIDKIADMQWEYFRDLHKLPKETQIRHMKKMLEYYRYEIHRLFVMWWWNNNAKGETFRDYHEWMIWIRKEQSRIILDRIKNTKT